MTMKNIEAGMKVRIIGDTFENDPHGLPIGSVHEVTNISPATSKEEIPPFIQLLLALEGKEVFDLPERVHIRYGFGELDFANVVYEDIEVVEGEKEVKAEVGTRVRMLEDDFCDGYSKGDVFDVYEKDGELYFLDLDEDERPLLVHEHEVI